MIDHFDTKEGTLDIDWSGVEDFIIISKKKWQKMPVDQSLGNFSKMIFNVKDVTDIVYDTPGKISGGKVLFIVKGYIYKDSFGDAEGATFCTVRKRDWQRLYRILEQIGTMSTCRGLKSGIDEKKWPKALREDM